MVSLCRLTMFDLLYIVRLHNMLINLFICDIWTGSINRSDGG